MPKYCKIYVKNRYIKDYYKNCSQKLRLSAKPKLQKKDCAKKLHYERLRYVGEIYFISQCRFDTA